ncbi:hypothetical protein RFI_08090 [Reticulomyxa filosa]|uniref:Uncharacterized protein n=1 Tax=Reticulomyxa filosa TaxID=46433 RepID=X6NUU7_RETFI|nr:hypothetical protein RFI_08090 [Reticulomyxa filosa]|eukprot:ETO29037.1 hypothetical protein RFI_08090 [Reticulomyxa filosa]
MHLISSHNNANNHVVIDINDRGSNSINIHNNNNNNNNPRQTNLIKRSTLSTSNSPITSVPSNAHGNAHSLTKDTADSNMPSNSDNSFDNDAAEKDSENSALNTNEKSFSVSAANNETCAKISVGAAMTRNRSGSSNFPPYSQTIPNTFSPTYRTVNYRQFIGYFNEGFLRNIDRFFKADMKTEWTKPVPVIVSE